MCAAVAGQRGRRVLVIDHADAPGKKILISGGGRCNFTNLHTAPDRYPVRQPAFRQVGARPLYAARLPRAGRAPRHRLARKDARPAVLRRLGANRSSRCCSTNAQRGGVDDPPGQPDPRRRPRRRPVPRRHGDRVATAPALVIATGGPSIPKIGATGFAYDLARRFGLKVVEPRPALVPLTLPGDEALFRDLSGVAVEVVARARQGARSAKPRCSPTAACRGPAILQVSSYWRHGEAIAIDFLPDAAPGWLIAAKRDRPRATLRAALAAPARPPRRRAGRADRRAANSARPRDAALADDRTAPAPTGASTRTAPKASPRRKSPSAASRPTACRRGRWKRARVPGLHAIGEAVDVTGWLGGYNFQWAWASGWAAAQNL